MYEVGQVLFLILNKRQQVLPVQVNEQVVRRSLDGEEISYSVAVPVSKGVKLYDLSELDGELYSSIEEARDVLYEHATQAINAITEKAAAVADSRFKVSPDPSLDDISVPEGQPQDSLKITLEDGTIANVKMPSNIPAPE